MRGLLVLLLAVCLLFTVSVVSFGAVHSSGSDFFDLTELYRSMMFIPENDKWFDIGKTQESFNGNVNLVNSQMGNITGINLQYLKNDQTFFEANSIFGNSGGSFTIAGGTYLFDFGLLVGAEYAQASGGSDGTLFITGGYSLKFGDQGYLTLSADYATRNDYSDLVDCEADLMYYLDKAKVFAELCNFRMSTFDPYQMAFMVGGDVAVTDQLTAGAKYMSYGSDNINEYSAGVTFHQDALTLNGKIQQPLGFTKVYYAVGGSYQLTENLSAGLTLQQFPDMNKLGSLAKLSYKAGIFNASLSINNDYYSELPLF